MRVAAQVLLAYAVLLVLGTVWRFVPLRASPDVAALFAAYLGLTARMQLAAPTLGAVVIGYLADLLMGTPRGMSAFAAGALCIATHLVHRRLLVRGRAFTALFAALAAVAAGLVVLAERAWLGLPILGLRPELATLAWTAGLSGLVGLPVFRLCRLLDSRFARTARERDAALQGLIP